MRSANADMSNVKAGANPLAENPSFLSYVNRLRVSRFLRRDRKV